MKLLSEFDYGPTRKYRGVLNKDLVMDLERGYKGFHEFYHEEKFLGFIKDDILTIFKGYASDLCSPGYYLFGKWFGTPAFGKELPAFIHDFTRQFMAPKIPCSPWDRKATDEMFFNAMNQGWGRSIYHGAVAGKLGDLWMWLNKPRPDVFCNCHKP